jgi:metal-responsive CopG/Arc/MetJ family transcriptional regulator
MAYKVITISLHPEDLEQLDELCKWHSETRSGMIRRLINYKHIEEVSKQ